MFLPQCQRTTTRVKKVKVLWNGTIQNSDQLRSAKDHSHLLSLLSPPSQDYVRKWKYTLLELLQERLRRFVCFWQRHISHLISSIMVFFHLPVLKIESNVAGKGWSPSSGYKEVETEQVGSHMSVASYGLVSPCHVTNTIYTSNMC